MTVRTTMPFNPFDYAAATLAYWAFTCTWWASTLDEWCDYE